MSEEEAKVVVRDAIAAGILHDMGSGSNVDICVIKANDKIDYIRLVGYSCCLRALSGVRKDRGILGH